MERRRISSSSAGPTLQRAPLAQFFSWTSENSLFAIGFGLGFLAVFGLFMYSSGRLQHEQSKLGWRTPVALTFLIGLGWSTLHHSRPRMETVTGHWAWAYQSEMIRLTQLLPELEAVQPDDFSSFEADPQPIWIEGDPVQSNTVFMPLQLVRELPAFIPYELESREHLFLRSDYTEQLSRSRNLGLDMWTDSKDFVEGDWAESYERPLLARWLVLYESADRVETKGEDSFRYWLIERIPLPSIDGYSHYEGGMIHSGDWVQFSLEIRAYDELPIRVAIEYTAGDTTQDQARDWMMESLTQRTGGEFKVQ